MPHSLMKFWCIWTHSTSECLQHVSWWVVGVLTLGPSSSCINFLSLFSLLGHGNPQSDQSEVRWLSFSSRSPPAGGSLCSRNNSNNFGPKRLPEWTHVASLFVGFAPLSLWCSSFLLSWWVIWWLFYDPKRNLRNFFSLFSVSNLQPPFGTYSVCLDVSFTSYGAFLCNFISLQSLCTAKLLLKDSMSLLP